GYTQAQRSWLLSGTCPKSPLLPWWETSNRPLANRAGGTIGGEKAMRATLEWQGMRGALSFHKHPRKKLIPALRTSPILPLTTPRIWTQALRTFGRDRFGFLTGRRGEGPKRTDGRMWIKGVSGPPIQSLPRRTGETRRGSEGTGGRLAEKVVPTFSVRPTDPLKTLNNPQPEKPP